MLLVGLLFSLPVSNAKVKQIKTPGRSSLSEKFLSNLIQIYMEGQKPEFLDPIFLLTLSNDAVKSRCKFVYFFSLCDIRNEVVFLILEHSRLRGKLSSWIGQKQQNSFLSVFPCHLASSFPLSDFYIFSSLSGCFLVEYPVLFILDKCLMGS